MHTLSAYDISQRISNRHSISFEDMYGAELDYSDTVVDSDLQIDTTDDDLADYITDANDSIDNLVAVDNATETLESLVIAMESSVLRGGFDLSQAHLANITLESVATRFNLDPKTLNFGLEEVSEDGEEETKSTISKAKEMIGALKSNVGALINKMYLASASALGNNAAGSEMILRNLSKIRTNINADNKGEATLSLNAKTASRLTIDGTPLRPDAYVKELNRALSKYNDVVKQYSDNDLLEGFVKDVITSMSTSDAQPKSKSAILSSIKNIQMGIDKPVKAGEGIVAFTSQPYLGNMCITSKKPSAKSIVEMINESISNATVSQEGVGGYAKSVAIQTCGALLYGAGQVGFVAGSASVALAGGIPMTLLAASVMVIGYYGQRKGVDLLKRGFDGRSVEIKKAIEGFRNRSSSQAAEAADISTEFEVHTANGFSMEAKNEVNIQALSAKQITQVLSILENTANTTRNMKKSLAGRKALVKQVNTLTAEISKNEGANGPVTKAAGSFVKQYIKKTIKFEMDITTYGVKIMKAAINYVTLSNGNAPVKQIED